MYDGSNWATVGWTSTGDATRTSPAPDRSADAPTRAAAPAIPRLPAMPRTWPYIPLWLSAGRLGRRGGISIRRRAMAARLRKCCVIARRECVRARYRTSVPPNRYDSVTRGGLPPEQERHRDHEQVDRPLDGARDQVDAMGGVEAPSGRGVRAVIVEERWSTTRNARSAVVSVEQAEPDPPRP